MRKRGFCIAAAIALGTTSVAAQTLKQLPNGVQLSDDANAVALGGRLIPDYSPKQPSESQTADRLPNRAVVERFFTLPIGDERAKLYSPDGIKQIPTFGVQWIGADAQLQNNRQNQTLFPGWTWHDVVIWDTQDPTTFWVEASGKTASDAKIQIQNHYVMQFVVNEGKITLFREFATPLKITK